MLRKFLKVLFYLILIFLIVIIGDDETRERFKKKINSLRKKTT